MVNTALAEQEEWISANDALALLGIARQVGMRTICKRAKAGMIQSRAERLIVNGKIADNAVILANFWWAEGGEALTQNWATGDFETWIDHKIQLQAFGVTFRRCDIERMRRTPNNPVTEENRKTASGAKVFIGHGHDSAWLQLRHFLEHRLKLSTDEFNSVSTAGLSTTERLETMLDDAAFAFLVMTAEDDRPDGRVQARLNVIHEVGLFQGRLGFKKAIILLEETCAEFSNIHGLGQIRFPKGHIDAAFEKVRGVLEREKIIVSTPPKAS